MKLNERGEIIDPNVGDAELVRMDFDPQEVSLHIKLARREGVFVLRLINPRWMSFSTNCPQNVIEKIIVTTDLKEATALAPKEVRELMWRRDQKIQGQKDTGKPLKAMHITPIAGPELTCIADDVIAIPVAEQSRNSTFSTSRIWDGGGWRVVETRMDGAEIPIADFVSLRDAEAYVHWKFAYG